jgi:hypothetical protein
VSDGLACKKASLYCQNKAGCALFDANSRAIRDLAGHREFIDTLLAVHCGLEATAQEWGQLMTFGWTMEDMSRWRTESDHRENQTRRKRRIP